MSSPGTKLRISRVCVFSSAARFMSSGGEHHELALYVFVALDHLAPSHGTVLPLADSLEANRRLVLGMKEPEPRSRLADGAMELDRDVDEPEGDRPCPERSASHGMSSLSPHACLSPDECRHGLYGWSKPDARQRPFEATGFSQSQARAYRPSSQSDAVSSDLSRGR